MRLLLIRHGEANRRGIDDLGLTKKGRAQAQRLADALDGEGTLRSVSRLVASPSPRAQETAHAIAAHARVEVETSASFCEMGELPPPGSNPEEEFASFIERISAALRDIAERHPEETVLVVSHAGVIVASLVAFFEIPRPGTGAKLEPDPCSVTEWEHRAGDWVLRRFNAGRVGAF